MKGGQQSRELKTVNSGCTHMPYTHMHLYATHTTPTVYTRHLPDHGCTYRWHRPAVSGRRAGQALGLGSLSDTYMK